MRKRKVLVAQSYLTLCNPMDCSPQAPLSMGFSRQEYQSGLPFPSLGIFPAQGSNPGLLNHRRILYRLSPLGSIGPPGKETCQPEMLMDWLRVQSL